MSALFRKSSLEKLSSPEQLDRAIVLTSPAFWLALLGGFVIVAGGVLWAIFCRIQVNVDAPGIYLSGVGTSCVYARVEGVVSEVKVSAGDEVKAGDVVAVVGGEEIAEQIAAFQKRIDAVQAVSPAGTDDTVAALGELQMERDRLKASLENHQSTAYAKTPTMRWGAGS